MRRVAGLALLLGLALAACAALAGHPPRPHERAFPEGFRPPISVATGRPIHGWGGQWQAPPGAETLSPSRTPILFIHGNTVDATYWEEARQWFRNAGWNDEELWAPSYGWGSTEQFDVNDLTAPTLDAFVDEVQRYLGERRGRPVRQFDIVAHSLGVTAVRQWLTQSNRWHQVRSFVAVAGANHGVWTARLDARGPSRNSSFELYRGSPWLAQLNAGGEVPGAMRVMTLYDGTGRYDMLFPDRYKDSPALAGAVNVAFNREAGIWNGGYNHLELPRKPATLAVISGFLGAGHEPLPNAAVPTIVRAGDRLQAAPADARLHCAGAGRYPDAATKPLSAVQLSPGQWLTCYAHSSVSGLSSPMARYAAAPSAPPDPAPLQLHASPELGPYAQPLNLTLTASAPDALIVYSILGRTPDSGSALYRGPIYLPAPVTLTAVAMTPDGRRSAPLRLRYDVSLAHDEVLHSLQRQLDPGAPLPD
ncbi:MAG: chitobiase/beta-hexosaminidase C-terminal domain-containing protein [Gammaproteobacteria bacterium]|nr:chitobiase/beta-hexosaminidase C-terminal domain-containing protein [Gammaproteobacteria bacterium]